MKMQKLFAILVLCFLFIQTLEKEHNCIHHTLKQNIKFTPKPDPSEKRNLAATKEPLRITYDFSALDSIPSNLSTVKENIKTQLLLAAKFFGENLKITRLTSNNVYPFANDKCVDVNVPSKDVNNGIPNSDLHIYVAHYDNAAQSTLAYAGACILDGATNRPVFGGVTFNLAYLKNIQSGNHVQFEDNFETVLHELTHVLGFSNWMFQYFINPATGNEYGQNNIPVVKRTIRGKTSDLLTTPKVLALTRSHYNCPSAEGMQLENEGGSGSAGSHWERVVLENEYMTASAISHDAVITDFTFALLEDSGWYEASAIKTDAIDWGKGQGCSFLTECTPSKFREFNSDATQCNFYHSGIGSNKTQYDPFNDNCYITSIYSNKHCSNPNNLSNFDQYLGNEFAEQNRCFISNIQDPDTTLSNVTPERCLAYECNADGTEISVIVKGEKYVFDKNTKKANIVKKGNNQKYTGYVNGPEDWPAFCNTYPKPCKNFCSSNGFCFGYQCHCDENHAGQDCSVTCSNGNYAYNGSCRNSKTCPSGTTVNLPTKECISSSGGGNPQTCPSGQFMYNGACVSSCPNLFYRSGDNCLSCASGCSTCTEATYCTACKSNYYQHTTGGKMECVSQCPSGYSPNAQNQCTQNVVCHSSCLECVTNTACTKCATKQYIGSNNLCQNCISGCDVCSNGTSCTTCTSGFYKYNNTCVNQCPTKFYASGSNCVSCNNSCATCDNGSSCSTCPAKNYKNSSNTCSQCIANCDSCANGSSCQTCTSGFVYVNNACVSDCPAKQYKSGSNCLPCHNSCESCTNGTSCSSCPAKNYKNSSNTCSQCIANCDSCTNGSSCQTCTSGFAYVNNACVSDCPAKQYKSGSNCLPCHNSCESCTNGTSCSSCPAKNYKNSSNTCSQCIANCDSCTNGSSCQTCTSGFAYVNNACVSDCPTKQYKSGSNCLPCHNSCESCTNGTTCSSCPAKNYKNSSNTCSQCIVNCDSCANGSSCQTCTSGFAYVNNACVSDCPTKQYKSGSNCLPCHNSCDSCTNGTSCSSCPAKNYKNSSNTCSQCIANCDSCTNGSSCQTCTSGFAYVNNACVSDCPTKQYKSGSNCLPCNNSCDSCTNGTSCSSCPSKNYKNANNLCSPCHSSCQSCNEATYCTECISGKKKQYDSQQRMTCVDTCPSGTYINNQNNTCTSCEGKCTQCTSSINCTQCESGYEVKNGDCVVKVTCPANCSSCSSSINCETCNQGFYVLNQNGTSQCVSSCPSEYFISSSKFCVKCPANCKDCQQLQGQGCNTCLADFHKTSNNQCIKCVEGCKECTSEKQCTLCKDDLYLVANGFDMICRPDCPTYQFPTNTVPKKCVRCDDKNCAKCLSQNTCSQCSNGYYLKDSKCTQCSPLCLRCDDTGSCYENSCLNGSLEKIDANGLRYCEIICRPGQFKINSYACGYCDGLCKECVDEQTCKTCFEGSYYSEERSKCLPCGLYCETCDKTDTCLSCFIDVYQHFDDKGKIACIEKCPEGYQPNKNRKCVVIVAQGSPLINFSILFVFLLLTTILA